MWGEIGLEVASELFTARFGCDVKMTFMPMEGTRGEQEEGKLLQKLPVTQRFSFYFKMLF